MTQIPIYDPHRCASFLVVDQDLKLVSDPYNHYHTGLRVIQEHQGAVCDTGLLRFDDAASSIYATLMNPDLPAMYTVHFKSVTLQIAHWYSLRHRLNSNVNANSWYDVNEIIYRHTVLTYPQRIRFDVATERKILTGDTSPIVSAEELLHAFNQIRDLIRHAT